MNEMKNQSFGKNHGTGARHAWSMLPMHTSEQQLCWDSASLDKDKLPKDFEIEMISSVAQIKDMGLYSEQM